MCIFCKIIDRELDSTIVYENDNVIAILDIEPLTKGHILVIPKKHYKNIYDTPAETLAQIMEVVKIVADIHKEEYDNKGFNLIVNNNSEAFQLVDHLHFHVVPRYDISEIKNFSKAK